MARALRIDKDHELLNSNWPEGSRDKQTMSRAETPSPRQVSQPRDEQPTTEPDVPSDGADEIGEAMIRDLAGTLGRPRQFTPDTDDTSN